MNSTAFSQNVILYLIVLSFFIFSCEKENFREQSLDVGQLEAAHEQYLEKSIEQRRFKYKDVISLVNQRNGGFFVEEIGESVEGKEIYQMSIGNGQTKVMLWSQMHGNESTATMALFDLFNFLEGKEDGFDSIRNLLFSKLSLRFIPMVNPDGMDQWIRRNALDIDLNRDAVSQISPEATLLTEARAAFSPDFGFNLHDQNIYYNVSQTPNPASISVLAPAFNFETEVNEVRKRAMQVIVGMNRILQQTIQGQVGKYDDAFEPRAFGDNFQKSGTSTILIESGGYPDDPEKQYIRKLNFMIILNALYEIAIGSYETNDLADYQSIPENDSKLMDLVIRNVPMNKNEIHYAVDLGIKRREIDVNEGFYVNGVIDDLGDLSVFYGYEELDAEDLQVVEGKVYQAVFEDISNITKERAMELLRAGYMGVKVKNAKDRELYDLPLLVLKNRNNIPFGMGIGGTPNFYLADKGKLKYAVLNGYLIDLESQGTTAFRHRVL